MGLPWRIDPTTHRTTIERSYHGATSRSITLTSTLEVSIGYLSIGPFLSNLGLTAITARVFLTEAKISRFHNSMEHWDIESTSLRQGSDLNGDALIIWNMQKIHLYQVLKLFRYTYTSLEHSSMLGSWITIATYKCLIINYTATRLFRLNI